MTVTLPIIKTNTVTLPNKIGGFHDAIIKGRVLNSVTRDPILSSVVIADYTGAPISQPVQTDTNGYFYITANISDADPDNGATEYDTIKITPIDGKKYIVPEPAAIWYSQFGLYTGMYYGDGTILLSQKTIVPLNLVGLALIGIGLYNSHNKKSVGIATNNTTKDITNAALVIGGGYLLFNGINIVDKILQLFGLSKSQATKTIDFASTDPNSFWNPNFWQKFSSYTYVIDQAQAETIIDQVMNAMSVFTPDDVSAVYGALFQLHTQANLSYLCYVFQQTQGADFLTWLRGTTWPNDRLDDAEIFVIHQHFLNLPTH